MVGPVTEAINDLCYGCHDQMQESMAAYNVVHFAAEDSCTNCHNPHNAAYRKLLLAASPELCTGCHDDIQATATQSTVQHAAITESGGCTNCHQPHASNVQYLLTQLPYDLCVSCHGADGVTDEAGTELTGFENLLASNPVAHGPVEAKDCSACHRTHGGENFRMLIEPYPAKFYAPYDPANYALCFECHNDQILADAETRALTGFRDGTQNLHYVHVNKPDRGRTCRACHEVHAAENVHILRDAVPYGSKGWMLKVNFTPDANGGTCEKTCHSTKSYDRSTGL